MSGTAVSRTALLLMVAAVLCFSPCIVPGNGSDGASAWDGLVDTSWYSDGGTSFTIETPSQLAGLAQLVNSGKYFEGKRVVLGSDIDLGGLPWTPIGSGETVNYNPVSFRGEFDGGFHTISGLSVTGSIKNAGLFGYVYLADVANLSVSGTVDVTIEGGVPYAGGITGKSYGSFIEDCRSAVSVNAVSIRDSSAIAVAGGIVGNSADDNIVNCYNVGTVHAEVHVEKSIGGSGIAISAGIAADLELASNIFNCYSSGMITATAEGLGANRMVGAIIGDASAVDIRGCYFLTGTEGRDSYPNMRTAGEFGSDGRTLEEMIIRDTDSIILRGYVVLDLLNQYADTFNGYDLADWYAGDDGLPCHRYSGGQSGTDPEEPVGPEEPTDPDEPTGPDDPGDEFVPVTFDVGDFMYTTREDGNLTLSLYRGDDSEPVIPGTVVHEGVEYRVTELGAGCFHLGGEVVTLPDTFDTVSPWAFIDSEVRVINLPASVQPMEGLYRTYNLQTLTIDPGNPYITVVDNIVYSKDMTVLLAYPYTGPTDVVTMPGLKSIGNYAFRCTPVEVVRIGEGVESMGNLVFMDCTELREVHVPSTLDDTPDLDYTDVDSIHVSEDNPHMKSVDGVVFSKDGTELIRYPTGRTGSYMVPDGITSLCFGSFRHSSLTSLTIPSTVDRIGDNIVYSSEVESITVDPRNGHYVSIDGVLFTKDGSLLISFPPSRGGDYSIPYGTETITVSAFYRCELESVFIPETVRTIEDLAFSYSPNLERVEFESSDVDIGFVAFELSSYEDHTCWIVAPDGFRLPADSTGNGITTFIYGEKPGEGIGGLFEGSNSTLAIAAAAVAAVVVVSVVAVLMHRRTA